MLCGSGRDIHGVTGFDDGIHVENHAFFLGAYHHGFHAGNLVTLQLQADRHQHRLAVFDGFHVYARHALAHIEDVLAETAQAFDVLPQAFAEFELLGVFGEAQAGCERQALGIVLEHRIQISGDGAAQTIPITALGGGRLHQQQGSSLGTGCAGGIKAGERRQESGAALHSSPDTFL